jgi:Domain of unknown function (DUF4440)
MKNRTQGIACLFAAAIGAAALGAAPAWAAESVTATLQRQTQELMDAVAPAQAGVWDRYMDPSAIYTSEDGKVLTKSDMLATIKPLAAGVSGRIKVLEFKATVHGTVAVTSHLDDEYETYHGASLHCQYRTTETWLQTATGWRLIGGQVLAVRTDPPAVPLTAQRMAEYCGSYALDATTHYDIRCNGGTLQGQQTGHKPEVLRAEAPDVLFVPGRPRYRMIVLRNRDGHVTGIAERREAWSLDWKRLP